MRRRNQFFKLFSQQPMKIITIFTMVAFVVTVAGPFFDELIKRLNPQIFHVESIIQEIKDLQKTHHRLVLSVVLM